MNQTNIRTIEEILWIVSANENMCIGRFFGLNSREISAINRYEYIQSLENGGEENTEWAVNVN